MGDRSYLDRGARTSDPSGPGRGAALIAGAACRPSRIIRGQISIARISLYCVGALALGAVVRFAGWLPPSLVPLGRPLAIIALITGMTFEIFRLSGDWLKAERLRWFRLASGLVIAVLVSGPALSRTFGGGSWGDRSDGAACALLGFAALGDLIGERRKRRIPALEGIGFLAGITSFAAFAVVLLWENSIPWSLWMPGFLFAALSLGVAGHVYLRVRRASERGS